MTKDVLTLREAAEYTGLKETTLRNMVWRRKITCYKSKSNRTYFALEDLKAYMMAGRVPSLAEEQSKAEVNSLQ